MNYAENPFPTGNSTSTGEKPEDKENSTSTTSKKSDRVSFRLFDRDKSEVRSEKPILSFLESDKDKASPAEKSDDSSHEQDSISMPLESLSGEEEQQAAQMLRAEARETRDDVESSVEADQIANEAVEEYDSKIIDEGIDPMQAFNEVLEDYGIDPSEATFEPVELSEEDMSLLNEQELDLSSNGDEVEIPMEARTEAAQEKDEEATEPDGDTATGGGSKKPPLTFYPGSPSGDGNSSKPNPWKSSRSGPNAMPLPGNISSRSYDHIRRDHRDYWSGFMSGGVVGYFVGHRRGRIKTEKKLQTVKKNLEKQVQSIDEKLKIQEKIIRKLVHERASTRPEQTRAVKAERTRERVPPAPKLTQKEVKEMAAPIPAAEIHIGKLVMSERPREVVRREELKESSELPKIERVERSVSPEATKKAVNIDSMSNHELLKYSEDVIIDNTSLRKIYETQLIGEKGLRRLLNEYVHGGDLNAALNREILERQIDFERDPSMRDTAAPANPMSTGSGSQSLETMIKRAEAALTNSQEEVAFLKAKAAHEDKQVSQHSRAINAVFLAIIVFLVIVIILLSFLRHG